MDCLSVCMQPCEPCTIDGPPEAGSAEQVDPQAQAACLRRAATHPELLAGLQMESAEVPFCAAVLGRLESLSGNRSWLLTLADPATGDIRAILPDPRPGAPATIEAAPIGEGLHGRVAQTGQPLLIEASGALQDCQATQIDRLQLLQAHGRQMLLVAPVIKGAAVLGTLGILVSASMAGTAAARIELDHLCSIAIRIGEALDLRREASAAIEGLRGENERLVRLLEHTRRHSCEDQQPIMAGNEAASAVESRDGIGIPSESAPTAEAEVAPQPASLERALSRIEKEMIVTALKQNRGFMAKAARQLGVTERIMALRVRKLGIDPLRFRTWPNGNASRKVRQLPRPEAGP